ncbi:BMP family ABC transporter substrate-binding protein [Devosia faecipullorum]|uniref:BMP family ABC transporter substrate-binding protein n=1 Tax=Devosia faecipullorum TaxID=2755039 RepID=UPI00187B9C1F|nr:BMP family ABC transporter substrate-binding protein [Devosia faecipullorum]MBE7732458.1 BMP family ABC transporter substrate-binding protein [Devosia faecipullorum]
MTLITRRNVLRIGAAGLTLPLLGSMAFGQDGPLKIGFVNVGPKDDNGWTYGHWVGAEAIKAEFGDQVEITFVESVAEGPDCERVLRELAQQGNKIIFATSFGFGDYVIKVAREFPDVVFEHATGYQRSDNVGTYNARFHEGRAVMGTLAGHLSKTNTIGYIGTFPIPEVVMGINAFTLAAQKVNPDIKVNVVWLSSWHDPAKESDATRALIDQGADIIAQHSDGPAALQVAEERGIVGGFGQGADMSAFAPKSHLSAIIDVWAPHYIQVVKDVQAGTWVSDDSWPGIAAGEVVIGKYNEKIPADVVAAAEAVKNGIIDGTVNPFSGPIIDNAGTERAAAGEIIDDAGLWAMDWFVAGVNS